MTLVRHVIPALVAGLVWAVPLGAQDSTGTIKGQVVDGTTQQAVANVEVSVVGSPHRMLTRTDGAFQLSGVPAGAHRLRATRIGYGPQIQDITVTAGVTTTVQVTLLPAASILEAVVVTGYGTQRREAITGSVSTIDASGANVGVISNANQMIQGRAAGVEITQNNGEPGAGAQILIRGGTSISATNAPLYVIDGVPINNVATEASGFGVGGSPPLPRSPLNLVNPSDIASITVLKDASATAIYGSRAANGVVLIETKKGTASAGPTMEYDSYVAIASPAKRLDVLDGNQYRQFVQQQVQLHNADATQGLDSTHLAAMGTANTNWEDAVTRTAVTHNQDFSITGGSEDTRYRASLNYMNQQGVAISNGFKRIQGRLNATHQAFDNRLRLGLNVTASRINNHYLTFENTGGFEGGVFQNVAVFNPTEPITIIDTGTGKPVYWELGCTTTGCPPPTRQSVRNPVAIANEVSDFGTSTRTLGNVSAELDLVPGLTGQVNVGVDYTGGERRIYLPAASPVGAEWNGLAQQSNHDNTTVTLQSLLTLRRQIGDIHTLDVVGGYEFSEYSAAEFGAQAQNFLTDAFSFDNLGVGNTLVHPYSWATKERLVSFFTRSSYGLKDRYFLTGVLRYDGSSKFATGHKWGLFPALSGSWHISQEDFMRNVPFSDLRLRVGWGLQGNPGVGPYSSLLTLAATGDGRYVFGEAPVSGVIPTSDANPNLKWEQTAQYNLGLDYGLKNNRISGSIDYYVKNTSDLLLSVSVPQPAPADHRLENVGKVRNRGIELSLDAVALSRRNLIWRAGLVFAMERNKVIDLGPYKFINTGDVSGQGQSGQESERIIPGSPLGTFYGPVFVGVDAAGKQLFRCSSGTSCVNGQTTTPAATDYTVIGNANPDFTLGVHSYVNWGKFDISFLVRAAVGQSVFNNTALVYSTKGNALQNKNFLVSALTDPTGLHEPAIFSSRWVEKASFVRLQNITLEYALDLPVLTRGARSARLYVSADNLLLLTGYSGLDPEVYADAGLASRGIDYLSYPRPRTITGGLRIAF